MLLEFSVENFKSFSEGFTFLMTPAQKQKGLDFSVKKINSKTRALCSSVIYGPNAVGKTSVIAALDFLKKIVVRGNLRRKFDAEIPDPLIDRMELIPNDQNGKPVPVKFAVKFSKDDRIFSYALVLDLGSFMSEKGIRKIKREYLSINDSLIFDRSGMNISFNKSLGEYLNGSQHLADKFDFLQLISKDSLKEDELYLTNGFKNILGSSLYPDIIDFFEHKLITFCESQNLRFSPKNAEDRTIHNVLVTEAAKAFGSVSSNLAFIQKNKDSVPVLHSKMKNGKYVNSIFFESLGTRRFINLFPILLHTLASGCCLVIDEFDNSLHPMAVMSLINIFHNDEINKNGAQLIFNSQNPMYLNNNLFRRDEIKFVDRDEQGVSTLYSLSDFGTKGTEARKGQNYMDNYFVDKYGAIRNIDFSDFFEDYLKKISKT